MELGFGLTRILVVPFYITAVIVILLTIFKRIEFGILFLIPFIPHQNILDRLIDLPLGKDINDLLFIAMLIKWIIDKRKAKKSLFIKTPLNLPILLFVFWTFIEIWWGAMYFGQPAPFNLADPRIIYWKNLIRIPLFYLIIVNNVKNPKHIKLIILLMIMAILLLDKNFYDIARWRDMSHFDETTEKIGGLHTLGGNELAVFLATYVIVLVSLFTHIRNLWIKLFLFGPIWLSYYCIAFLFSRSGYLATFAGWAVIGFLKDRKMFVFIVAIVLFWQTLLPQAVKERIAMTKTEEGYDGTTQQRIGMWDQGLEIIFSSPILGCGIDATRFTDVRSEGFGSRTWHSFHNSYIQQTVETGLVGLGIYLWIFFLMIKMGWRMYRAGDSDFHKGLGLGLIACVLSCMAGNFAGSYWNFFEMTGYMYVLAALVMISMINIAQERSASLPVRDKIDEATY